MVYEMSEGSLEAPTRHNIPWQEPEYIDPEKIDNELRRVFDICHGCRRCFNLCDTFPRLFDLIDESESGELDTVQSKDFKPAIDACTMCDMCFMTKCPYVPPHEFDLDFPHLMLRYRAMEFGQGKVGFFHRQMAKTDLNGKIASYLSGLINWVLRRGNLLTRPLMKIIAGIHKDATLPMFTTKTFERYALTPVVGKSKRKVVLYATCFVNHNNPKIGELTQAILAKNGVETEVVYPSCCGMPQLEYGDISSVAQKAKKVSTDLIQWIDKGYDVIALVPSCALMLKFEWPLILPDNKNVKRVSAATYDLSEYIVDIAKKEGLSDSPNKLSGSINLHLSCHARAQNMGPKAAEMLALIPDAEINVIERCSGHGGSWGVMQNNFDTAIKIGLPVARKISENDAKYIVSECPLACEHIIQGVERLDMLNKSDNLRRAQHPIEIVADAYGIKS